MWHRILTLIYKEILAVWRDKKSRMVLVMPPITQLFIFAFAATLDVKNVPIGILNLDNGEKGFELVQRFHGSPFFSKIRYLNAVDEISPFIDNMDGLLVVFLDEQFSRNLDAGRRADVQLIMDGRRSNTSQIVAGYVGGIIDRYNLDYTREANIYQENIQLITRYWFNPNLIYYWYNVPCLSGILTMLVGLVVTALSIARERELGTFDQLMVSPLLPIEILIGKMVPAIIIGMIEGTIIVLVGVFLFGIPFHGSILLLYFSMFVFICSIVGIGLFISSLAQTQQQALLGTFVFMSPSIMLSGFATPIENMPTWLQPVTLLIPLRYYLVIAKGLFLKAMPFHIVMSQVWPMALIACFTLSASVWFFRRRIL